MKKNYQVTITDGEQLDSFNLLGNSKEAVKDLCNICYIGTGWSVKNVELAIKNKKPVRPLFGQLCLF